MCYYNISVPENSDGNGSQIVEFKLKELTSTALGFDFYSNWNGTLEHKDLGFIKTSDCT